MENETEKKVRLQKWLAHQGIASRREAETWIKAERLSVNGQTASLGAQIVPGRDVIKLDSKPLGTNRPAPYQYWILNKPDLCLTSRQAEASKQTIYDLKSLGKLKLLLHPVGRLDFRSEGLLILTNDGSLTQKVSHPKHQTTKTYRVLTNRRLEKEAEKRWNVEGVSLRDGRVQCQLKFLGSERLGASRGAWYEVTVCEGKNRLVRRMFEREELRVCRLVRTKIGCFELPSDLKPGNLLALSKGDLQLLLQPAHSWSSKKSLSPAHTKARTPARKT